MFSKKENTTEGNGGGSVANVHVKPSTKYAPKTEGGDFCQKANRGITKTSKDPQA